MSRYSARHVAVCAQLRLDDRVAIAKAWAAVRHLGLVANDQTVIVPPSNARDRWLRFVQPACLAADSLLVVAHAHWFEARLLANSRGREARAINLNPAKAVADALLRLDGAAKPPAPTGASQKTDLTAEDAPPFIAPARRDAWARSAVDSLWDTAVSLETQRPPTWALWRLRSPYIEGVVWASGNGYRSIAVTRGAAPAQGAWPGALGAIAGSVSMLRRE